MAIIRGKAGRYVEDQSVKKAQQFVAGCLVGAFVGAFASGFLISRSFGFIRVPFWISIPLLLVTMVSVFFGNRHLTRKLDSIERERISYRKGAVGEALIGYILEGLPDDYVVINDLKMEFGNLDHVVIGPTGVYAIDTKNWKGTVTPDGNGELLVNGKPTTKTEVKNLVRTVMSCREQVLNLCKSNRLDCDVFIRAVLAFPSARVEAPFGKVKNADCVTDEKLCDYITDKYNAGKLNKQQIDIIARAFLALARMDSKFSDTALVQSVAL